MVIARVLIPNKIGCPRTGTGTGLRRPIAGFATLLANRHDGKAKATAYGEVVSRWEVSDLQRAEECLKRTRISGKRFVTGLPLLRENVLLANALVSLRETYSRGDRRTYQPDSRNHGRCLIDGSVNFVIRSLGKISLRDG